MLRNSTDQAMINRGRKAGLSTRELYQAMATRPVEAGEPASGQADGNGYIASVSPQGRRLYRPAGAPRV
jgi:hypothetical protein